MRLTAVTCPVSAWPSPGRAQGRLGGGVEQFVGRSTTTLDRIDVQRIEVEPVRYCEC
jgi:hypothetical protein